jgi:hypothetical protein
MVLGSSGIQFVRSKVGLPGSSHLIGRLFPTKRQKHGWGLRENFTCCSVFMLFPCERQTAGGTCVSKRWQLAREKLLLPKKCLFTQERHLCPQAIKKTYKTQFPTWLRGPPVSSSCRMTPCSLSFLFSTNKSSLTFAAQVCLWFLSKSGPRPFTTMQRHFFFT